MKPILASCLALATALVTAACGPAYGASCGADDKFHEDCNDFEGPGSLKSSIYYLDESDNYSCSKKSYQVLDLKGGVIGKVCSKFGEALQMEGSGVIVNGDERTLINYVAHKGGVPRYAIVDNDCKHGLGVSNVCLIPFISIAADLDRYDVGDVIYVPAIAERKITLPNGKTHLGYFIVSDKGQAIDGKGRFDLFTGGTRAFGDDNPFTEMGLAQSNDEFRYYKVNGETAEKVRAYYDFGKH